jgi:beta-lactamase regulating signal transducer with metallopeptidase domain/biopolymer transport protein ExbD
MMASLFDWVFAASLRASVLTVVVLLAQTILRRWLSASWRHTLWLPVLVVLLMPTFLQSRWSVATLVQPTRAALSALAAGSNRSSVDRSPPAPQRVRMAFPRLARFPWQKLVGWIWLVGAAGTGGIGLATFLQTLRSFRRSRIPVRRELQEATRDVAREIGLMKVLRIWMSPRVQSPAVTGLFRPVLLLPADLEESLAPEETRLVLKHELTHLQRGDLPLNALLCLLLALHWFNPLLWIAFFKSRQDREAACDAQVLRRESTAQRVAYGHTLLKVETTFHHPGLGVGFVGIFGRGGALRFRIESLLNQPMPHPLMKTALSISLAILTSLGVTQAALPEALISKAYLFPPDRRNELIADAEVEDIKEALLKNGVPFPSGAAVHWTPKYGGMLTVFNTKGNMGLLESLLFPDLARRDSPSDSGTARAVDPSAVQTIDIDREGLLRLNERPIVLQQLEAALCRIKAVRPEVAVFIRVHQDLPFQKLSGLFEAVRRAEISKLSFSTDPKSEPPTSRP